MLAVNSNTDVNSVVDVIYESNKKDTKITNVQVVNIGSCLKKFLSWVLKRNIMERASEERVTGATLRQEWESCNRHLEITTVGLKA